MSSLETILIAAAAAAALAWTLTALHVLQIEHRRNWSRNTLSVALGALHTTHDAPLDARVAILRPLLAQASRELIMQAAVDHADSRDIFEALTAYLAERWGIATLERDAAAHHSAREKWRRMTALRILFRVGHPRSLDLSASALDEADEDVAAVALSLLGRSGDPRAIDLLIGALKEQRHAPARVAAELDRSMRPSLGQLKPLLKDSDPVVRFWGATLLGRYADADDIEHDLAALADDPDARVRQAAIESLGRVGDELAAACAKRLLHDPVASVRADAARAVGMLLRTDLAESVTVLLGDAEWSVRRAAKDALENLGADVWPVLTRCLDHPDRFVRNGAAEIIQNLGVLDSLVVMEAATDDPAEAKINMLRRIATAGGVRLTDSLIERAGPVVGPRIRALLGTIGLDHVEATS